ncbi:MAG: hypothetical protein DCC55_34005 [Chloroflexi bacterium]|nr:MAG: hypothetical protein DCC55_34005 [Chloroflexota bacterium]
MDAELSLIQPKNTGETARARQRILLYQDELYRVPPCYETLRVIAGVALVTQGARDLILTPGHEAHLQRSQDIALVSALRGSQLVVELYAN